MSSTIVVVRRSLCVVLVVGHLGCSSWRTRMAPPAVVLTEKPPSQIRVLLLDDTKVVLRNPRLESDSLVGDASSGRREGPPAVGRHRAIPLDSVARVEYRESDQTKTALLVIGGAIAVGLVVAAIAIWSELSRIQ